MIKFNGLGHINIVVDDITKASEFYERVFGAVPQQEFPHFKNRGFAMAAGFMDNPDRVDVSIRFLEIPGANLFLELMEYHSPQNPSPVITHETNAPGGPRHICLRVADIHEAFRFIQKQPDIKMINSSEEYNAFKIDPIRADEFYFFDSAKEADMTAKQEVCDIVGQIRYFYFIDKYGVQWELEEGHADIGA